MKVYISILVTVITVGVLGAVAYLAVNYGGSTQERPYHRGVREYEIGHYRESIGSFNEYLSLNFRNKKSNDAKFRIALALKKLGETDNAKKKLADVISDHYSDEDTARAVIEYADICRVANMYDYYIIGQIELLLRRFPEGSDLENALTTQFGYQQLFLKQYEVALHHFMRSSTELSILGKARAYHGMNDIPKSLSVYEEFLTYNPGSSLTKEVLRTYLTQASHQAIVNYRRKNFETAIHYFGRIQKYFPNTADAENALYYSGEAFYELENYDKALGMYAQTLENSVSTRDAEALLKIGLCYYWLKNYAACYNAMDKFLREYPASVYSSRAEKWKDMAKKELEYMGGESSLSK